MDLRKVPPNRIPMLAMEQPHMNQKHHHRHHFRQATPNPLVTHLTNTKTQSQSSQQFLLQHPKAAVPESQDY